MIRILAEAGHGDGSTYERFLELLTDPAHIAFEFVMDGVAAALIYPVGRWALNRWITRHDAEHHAVEHEHEVV